MKPIKAIRGMNDLLPDDAALWQFLESQIRQLTASYCYREIRTPTMEKTALFQRGIGEATDIVEKEMYTFPDRNDESLTLRPEGTAGVVRAGIENGLLYNQQQRLWYLVDLFRYERPQKGRYRQFHQFGIEAFGLEGPDIDLEVILLTARLWKMIGIADELKLHINSLGSPQSRARYRGILVEFFNSHFDKLDEDSQRRLHTNPLRILDSKNPQMQELIKQAPSLSDHLDEASQQHFQQLCSMLTEAGIEYEVDSRLVRGLDYYNRTVFEWMTDSLGAQGTVCGGGRYDGLVEQLGGQSTPAIGFGMGMERVVLMLKNMGAQENLSQNVDLYLMSVGEKAKNHSFIVAETLRNAIPQLKLLTHCGGGNMKKLFKRADKSGASWALIISEIPQGDFQLEIKPLREDKEQFSTSLEQCIQWLQTELN